MNHVREEEVRCVEDACTFGLTGKGVGVAVLDTGLFPHKDFENRIRAFADMVNRKAGTLRRAAGMGRTFPGSSAETAQPPAGGTAEWRPDAA